MTYVPAMPALEHQSRALIKSAGREAFAYLMDYGTGKSYTVITDAGQLWDNRQVSRILVVAPKGNYDDWTVSDKDTSHWLKSAGEDLLNDMKMVVWRGFRSKKEIAIWEEVCGYSQLSIMVINVEAFSHGHRALDYARAFLSGGGKHTMMIIDESTTIRSPSASCTKAVWLLSNMATYRRILTGYPTPHSSLDLWAQFKFLDWRILGHSSYFSFRARYAQLETKFLHARQFKVVTGYQHTEELWEKIEPHSFRILADECLDLPEATYNIYQSEMSGEQRRVYNEVKQNALSKLGNEQYVSATLVLTQLLRLHQIACGFVVTEDGVERDLPCPRLDDLLEVIAAAGEQKTVIWSHWTYCVKQIEARLAKVYGSRSVVTYFGETSEADRAIAKQRFANDPTCLFFVGNPQTGGRGLNDLIVSRHAIYYATSHNLEHRLNSEARTRRKGSEIHKSVVYTDIVSPNTVEEPVLKALRARIDLASAVTGEDYRKWVV